MERSSRRAASGVEGAKVGNGMPRQSADSASGVKPIGSPTASGGRVRGLRYTRAAVDDPRPAEVPLAKPFRTVLTSGATSSKVLKLVMIFIALLFVGDRLGAWCLQKLVARSQDRYVAMYEGRAKADILVLGNSRADNHFPPQMMSRALGVTTVNLGLGGVSAKLSEALMQDFIERNGAPRLIVLEVTVLAAEPSTIGDMMIFTSYSPRIAALLKESAPRLFYTMTVFNLFQYNNEMLWRILYHVWKPPFDRVHHGTMTPAFLEQIRKRSVHLPSYADNEAALGRMLDYAQQRGIPVRIVITPYLKDQFAKFTNFESWRARVEQLTRGQKIWDYSQSFEDYALFRDSVHMNTAGTMRLLQVMISDGFYDELQFTPRKSAEPRPRADPIGLFPTLRSRHGVNDSSYAVTGTCAGWQVCMPAVQGSVLALRGASISGNEPVRRGVQRP